uniref:Uncharacterized protein n=1 Tax=Onchocerca volvulus TaxID=6282 RepID=A0A8R1TMT5_ONCVO
MSKPSAKCNGLLFSKAIALEALIFVGALWIFEISKITFKRNAGMKTLNKIRKIMLETKIVCSSAHGNRNSS